MQIVVIAQSVSSASPRSHATTFAGLAHGLSERGHEVLFLESAGTGASPGLGGAAEQKSERVSYRDPLTLATAHATRIAAADLVIVGSGVPEGVAVLDVVLRQAGGCVSFYDLDTAGTMAALSEARPTHAERRQIPGLDLYLTSAGGRTLDRLEDDFGARRPRTLFDAVDPVAFAPTLSPPLRDLSYLGTCTADSRPAPDGLLCAAARAWPEGRFTVAGVPSHPDAPPLPTNVEHVPCVPTGHHAAFYGSSRFTLHVTPEPMQQAGYAPSARLFQAASCGSPIISNSCPGLSEVFVPGEEILVADGADAVLSHLRDMTEAERLRVGARARARVMQAHTPTHRAEELERHVRDAARPA